MQMPIMAKDVFIGRSYGLSRPLPSSRSVSSISTEKVGPAQA
jgi:hypothetical protein